MTQHVRNAHKLSERGMPNDGPDSSHLVALCDAAEVTDDTPVRIEGSDVVYAVFALEGAYFVMDDLCNHGPGSLAEGFIEGCEVECPFHQGKFDIRTGCATAAPCVDPQRIWTAHVVDGKICIDPSERRFGG